MPHILLSRFPPSIEKPKEEGPLESLASQGMKSSPTICQWFVNSLLSPVRTEAGKAIALHYMNDVLVCASDDNVLVHALDLTISSLAAAGFNFQKQM